MKHNCIVCRSLRFFPLMAIALTGAFLSSCKKAPDEVLSNEDMAQLMADIHLGEAMVDYNYTRFPDDSSRKLLKQSIYAAHGVTAEQVDTSFVWYGHHIEDYIKVYNRTIEILEERERENTSASQIVASGDSVQVWKGPQRLIVSNQMPSRVISFSLYPDSTWKNGDVYILSYKPIYSLPTMEVALFIDYEDGTTDYVTSPNSSTRINTFQLRADSVSAPVRVYGYMTFVPEESNVYEIDSISLTRIRKELMLNNYFHQSRFGYGADDESGTHASQSNNNKDSSEEESISNRRFGSTTRYRKAYGRDNDRPKSSQQNHRTSEHRKDAVNHKPTGEQRHEVARQRQVSGNKQERVPMHKIGADVNKPVKENPKKK